MSSLVLPIGGLVTVPEDVTLEQLHHACAVTGFSRFPVLDHTGELSGYVHLKDVLEISVGQGDQPIDRRWLRPLVTVSPDDSLPWRTSWSKSSAMSWTRVSSRDRSTGPGRRRTSSVSIGT